MSAESLTLEYEVKSAELSAFWLRLPWVRKTGAVVCLFAALGEAADDHWWRTTLLVALSMEMWFRQHLLVWVVCKLAALTKRTIPVQVVADEQGVLVHYHTGQKTSPTRFWWSRLSDVREDDLGLMLLFDRNWTGLLIPWRAFENAEQRVRFLHRAREHHEAATPPKSE